MRFVYQNISSVWVFSHGKSGQVGASVVKYKWLLLGEHFGFLLVFVCDLCVCVTLCVCVCVHVCV